MLDSVRGYALPAVLGAVLAFGVSVYDTREALVVSYERPTLSYEAMIALETSSSDQAQLLPDLVPLPARDLTLTVATDNHLHLLFSTTYYNQGTGALELRADPKSAGVADDLDRTVYQRLYLKDGSFVDSTVGVFGWHQSHLHYHFSDFVSYVLTSETTPGDPIILEKATFCIRDISRLLKDVPGKSATATYTVCGKERQGVSVGWGDTYYYNYPDQTIDLEDIPSGTYRLSFIVNPGHRLRESAYLNNRSYVVFNLNKENHSVTVQKEFPENPPEIEHIHLDDPFGV